MSLLEDLIGKPLHEISDEELDSIVSKGRLAREEQAPARKTAAKKAAKQPANLVEIDLDDF